MATQTTIGESISIDANNGNTAGAFNWPGVVYWPSQAIADKPWIVFLFIQTLAGVAVPLDGTNNRVVAAVAMPMPPSGLKAGYSVNYQPHELGLGKLGIENSAKKIQGLASMGKDVVKAAMNKDVASLLSLGITDTKTIISNAESLASILLTEGYNVLSDALGDQATNVARDYFRQRLNPRLEQLYQNVEYRDFSYDWVLAPQRQSERNQLDNIIAMFKYAMLPAYASPALTGSGNSDGAFAYPYEFDILYFDATHMFQPLRCALDKVEVDYAPQGLAFFRDDESGSTPGTGISSRPAVVTLRLHFKEMQLLTRDQFAFNVGQFGLVETPTPGTRTYLF